MVHLIPFPFTGKQCIVIFRLNSKPPRIIFSPALSLSLPRCSGEEMKASKAAAEEERGWKQIESPGERKEVEDSAARSEEEEEEGGKGLSRNKEKCAWKKGGR